MKKKSVIIPTYNSHDYLIDNLVSLQNFNKDIHEIIVIDDWSTDWTERVINHKFPDIIYKKIMNSGAWAARNAWAKIATWDILTFIDADVAINKNIFHYISQIFENTSEISIVWWRVINKNTEWISELHHLIEFWWYTWTQNKDMQMVPSLNLSILKEVFDKIWWFDITLVTWEDNDICEKASYFGAIKYNSNVLAIHNTQWWWKNLMAKQFKFGKNFIRSRDANKNLWYQIPRNKRLILVLFIPFVLFNVVLIVRYPYFWQKWWKFIPSIPVIFILKRNFWRGVISSL